MIQVVIWWRLCRLIQECLYLVRLVFGNGNYSLVFYFSIRVNWPHSTRSRFILQRCRCGILFLFEADRLFSIDADCGVVSDIGSLPLNLFDRHSTLRQLLTA